jgi:valine dehydrogenase (NAD+)
VEAVVLRVDEKAHGLSGKLPLIPGAHAGFSFNRAKVKAETILDTTLRVLWAAEEAQVSPAVMADRMAEERMASVGRLATLRLQRGW